MSATLQALLECYCPKGAAFYYLIGVNSDEVLVRYPSEGAYRVRNPYQPPTGTPPSRYMLQFVRNPTDTRTVPHVNAPAGSLLVTLSGAEGATPETTRADLPRHRQLGAGAQITVVPKGMTGRRRSGEPAVAAVPSQPEDESVQRARNEAKIRGLALDVKLREQRVERVGAVTDDLVDALQLNQFYRHEVQDLTHDTTTLSGQHFEMMGRSVKLIEHLQDSVGRHIELSKAQLEKLATPPAPPDYNPSIVAGLNMIRDLGVAFAQRRRRRRKRRPLSAASAVTARPADQGQVAQSDSTNPVQAATNAEAASPSRPSGVEDRDTTSDDAPPTAGKATAAQSPDAQPQPTSVPAAMISAVMDTLRAAKVPGTDPERAPPLVAPVASVSATPLRESTAPDSADQRPLLDRKTTEEMAAVLAEWMRRRKSGPEGGR
jgi:hypothetical protein